MRSITYGCQAVTFLVKAVALPLHTLPQWLWMSWCLGVLKLLRSKLWQQLLCEPHISCMLWKGGDTWGGLLFIHGRPRVALLWVSMHKTWHKLYASGGEWLDILWRCTTETRSYLLHNIIPVCLKPRFTRISTGNSICRYFICSWVRM